MSLDGQLAFLPQATLLESISPTRFVALQQCALREVWSASGAADLLPRSPAARVGSIIHRLLEEAGKGAFGPGDGASVDRRWQELVGAAEGAMSRTSLERHFVPLSRSVPSLEVRRIQARERALELSETAARSGAVWADSAERVSYGCELPVSAADGRVRGRIDAVVEGRDGPVIRDYKSGAIFEAGDEHILKEAYAVQLRMYAALYAATTGRIPAQLEIVPILGTAASVPFDIESSASLLDEALEALDAVNRVIATEPTQEAIAQRLARPKPEVCGYCTFRPGCRPYHAAQASEQGSWPRDVEGRLRAIVALANGRTLLEIDVRGTTVRIRGLSRDGRHPALETLRVGDPVSVYNMRPTGSPAAFTESPFTVVYRIAREHQDRPNEHPADVGPGEI